MKFMLMVCAAFLARREPGLDHREARLHEHHEEAGEQRPDDVDRDLLWPTVSMTSVRSARSGSLDGTSLAVPVVAPVGSLTGAGGPMAPCAWRRCGTRTSDATERQEHREMTLLKKPVLLIAYPFLDESPVCSVREQNRHRV